MEVDSEFDWNIETYKNDYESDEHWELRKTFLIANKNKFDEEKLLCLAQVFVNIELLGCKYPLETMKLVEELSKGIVETFRDKRKFRLQRTFVPASQAASEKVKRPINNTPREANILANQIKFMNALEKSFDEKMDLDITPKPKMNRKNVRKLNNNKQQQQQQYQYQHQHQQQQYHQQQQHFQLPQQQFQPMHQQQQQQFQLPHQQFQHPQQQFQLPQQQFQHPQQQHQQQQQFQHQQESSCSSRSINLPPCPFGKIILIEPADRLINPVQTINRSMHLCHIKPTFNTIPGLEGKQCDLYLDDKLLATATEYSVKAAKEAAARIGIDKLKETCYTIKIKHKFLADFTIDKSFQNTFEEDKSTLGDNNIGNKLLRLMGWTGGGLGKTQQGIHEPVQVQEHVNRVGLGLTSKQITLENPRKFRAMIHKVINNFLQKDSVQDLVFSSEFTGEERKEMHNIIRRYNLKTKSYGKDINRKLVVSKKVNFFDVVESLLKSGGSNEKYELEKPNGLL